MSDIHLEGLVSGPSTLFPPDSKAYREEQEKRFSLPVVHRRDRTKENHMLQMGQILTDSYMTDWDWGWMALGSLLWLSLVVLLYWGVGRWEQWVALRH